MKRTKIDTLFKAQTRRMTPYLRGKQKPNNGLPRTAQRNFLQNQFANTCNGYFGFHSLSVFRLARHFCTALLVDTILIFKDNAENTLFTGAKTIPYLRIENLKNPTLSRGTYLFNLYMEVPSPGGQ